MTCLALVGGSFTGNNLEFLLFSFSTLLNENQSNRRQIILMNFWALHVKRLLEKIYLKMLNFAPMLVLLLSCLNIKNCLIQGKYFHLLFSNWWATTKSWNQVFVRWESSGSSVIIHLNITRSMFNNKDLALNDDFQSCYDRQKLSLFGQIFDKMSTQFQYELENAKTMCW